MKNFREIFLFLIILKKLGAQNCNIGNFKCGNSCCNCYNGYYCNDPSKSPVPCPAGTYSYSNTGTIIECTPCSSGYFSGNASSGCYRCPDGHQCNDPSKTSSFMSMLGSFSYSSTGKISECTPCSSGYFSSNSSWECRLCFQGHQCCDPSQRPVPCPAGSYTDTEGSTYCKTCSNQCPPQTNAEPNAFVDSGSCNFYKD
ncbi:unnamed protein product [Brachionus calyciflorus]|uniref:Tyrosine-protein kinase ephrin type A/B receptor-like domain-containing protein n=1 Tax=Brachionus calyciflorus TaxID=104777 RepID=A0A813XDE1_9BILA|nr:unnamed protein product [Brachionus calyciflorus]